MKEMVYWPRRTAREILHSGKIKGYQFYIVSYGTHPCAYVKAEVPRYQEDKIECNGGITYSGNAFKEFDVKGKYIGWDYAHCWDFAGYDPKMGGKIHTTEEIMEDVKKVISQLISLSRIDALEE